MFRDIIQQTAFTTQPANQYFHTKIRGEAWRGSDNTFESTLRALLANRIKEGDPCIEVHFKSSSYSLDVVKTNRMVTVLDAIYNPTNYDPGIFSIVDLRGTDDVVEYEFDMIKENFVKTYRGFKRLEKVSLFYKKSFKADCYINESDRKVVLFVDNLTARRLHYLQCGIFAMLPWYFNPEDGVTKEEMSVIEALKDGNKDDYLSALQTIADNLDFRSAFIRNALNEIEKVAYRTELHRAQRDLERIAREIDNYLADIRNHMNTKNDLDIKILGLSTKLNEDAEDSELTEYFLCNKKLILSRVDESVITFVVKDYLTYFDEDMARTVIDNKYSFVYEPDGDPLDDLIPRDDIKKLMTAIFVDQSLKFRVCAAYRIKLGSSVEALQGFDYDVECNDSMPNPHIDRYECLGTYAQAINQCLGKNDAIGAIEQCVASCKSLNFADSAVMKVFMRRICAYNGYSHNHCIELPDGKVVDPEEAIAWLKEQEKEVDEAQQEATQEEAKDE